MLYGSGKSCFKKHWGQVEKKGAEELGSLLKTQPAWDKTGDKTSLPVHVFWPV